MGEHIVKTHPDYLIKIAKLINKHANIQDTSKKRKLNLSLQ